MVARMISGVAMPRPNVVTLLIVVNAFTAELWNRLAKKNAIKAGLHGRAIRLKNKPYVNAAR